MRGYIRPAPTNFPFRWLAPAVTHDWQALLVGRRRHRSVSPTARITMTRPHFQLTSIGLSNGLLRDGK
jgi:predicted secreted Zn-dependent protease